MGRIATVLALEGADEIKIDGDDGDSSTPPHFAPPGDDSRPLPGDDVLTLDVDGAGSEAVVGYADGTAKTAGAGERRIYARDASGAVVCELYLKGDGAIEISTIASGNSVTINGVTIDAAGNISAPGEVTAKAGASAVKLSTHMHPTAMGPSGPPTPGT